MRAMRIPRPLQVASLATCLAILLAAPEAVVAHAELESTSPEAGSTVATPPATVSATFDDDLVAGKSSIEVLAPGGSTVGTGGVDPDDPKTLSASVPTLSPGIYDVRWAAATEDGHLERGRYDFTVAEGASAAPTPAPTAAAASSPSGSSVAPSSPPATASPVVAPSPSPSTDGSDGSESVGQIAILAVIGLGLGLGIGWWRSRRPA